jgi:hypothetical protein
VVFKGPLTYISSYSAAEAIVMNFCERSEKVCGWGRGELARHDSRGSKRGLVSFVRERHFVALHRYVRGRNHSTSISIITPSLSKREREGILNRGGFAYRGASAHNFDQSDSHFFVLEFQQISGYRVARGRQAGTLERCKVAPILPRYTACFDCETSHATSGM